MQKLKRTDLVHPELSYQIVGCAFSVHNELGGGHHEKYYGRALSEALKSKGLVFREQVYFPLQFEEKIVGKSFLDFLVDNQVVVEIKKGDRFSKKHIDQVLKYLLLSNLKLAILINFGTSGVSFRRIVNFNS